MAPDVCTALRTCQHLSFSVNPVEQGHSCESMLVKLHKRLGTVQLRCRGYLAQIRSLFTKDESVERLRLVKKAQRLERMRPQRVSIQAIAISHSLQVSPQYMRARGHLFKRQAR